MLSNLLISTLGTLIGGLLLTMTLFLLNEYAFRKINLTGEWKASATTKQSSYKPFENLAIEYKIHLLQKGYDLSGSGEKIKETNGRREETVFKRENRILIRIEGYVERKYFRKSKIYLSIKEGGLNRETRATYFLTLNNTNSLDGSFTSTAADARGGVKLQRV